MTWLSIENVLSSIWSNNPQLEKRWSAMGTIDAGYVSGLVPVIFDDEDVASVKLYPYIRSYTPVAGDRVLLVRSGHAWVVWGEIINEPI